MRRRAIIAVSGFRCLAVILSRGDSSPARLEELGKSRRQGMLHAPYSAGRPGAAGCPAPLDRPQQISCLVYEVEECRQERTQEVRVEVSSDHGRTYRQVLVQEYTFSPQGAIFQHEELRLEQWVPLDGAIRPNIGY
jgi:hypothetical protein